MRLPPSLAIVDGIEGLYAYEGSLADPVMKLKFGGRIELAGALASLMCDAQRLRCPLDVVTWVPLHRRRKLWRGFDQAELLARWLMRHLGLPPPRRVLARTRHTSPQRHLDALDRHANLRGAFSALEPVRGRDVLVIDDVTTTGSTMRACGEALQRAGATSVGGLCLLRRLRED